MELLHILNMESQNVQVVKITQSPIHSSHSAAPPSHACGRYQSAIFPAEHDCDFMFSRASESYSSGGTAPKGAKTWFWEDKKYQD